MKETNHIERRKDQGAGARSLVLLGIGLLLALGVVIVLAQRRQVATPAQTRPRRVTAPPADQTVIKAGADLQAVVNRAKPGDVLTLEAGATFKGPITLPKKAGDAPVTIQSSRLGELPPGARVTPAQAGLMPKIVSPGGNQPALLTAPGAHHYRLIGLEITVANAEFVNDLVLLGDGSTAQNTPDKVPHHLVIDRCLIRPLGDAALKRGVGLHSAETEITNSHISGFKAAGLETQAIAGWNGPGPYLIENNFVEGAGENLLLGGADPAIKGLVPSDIRILRNHFFKPLEWRGRWSVKNLFELKNARRVLIEGNVFENNWVDAQYSGCAILFTVRNQGGQAPWSVVRDVKFVNNLVRRAGSGLSVSGRDDIHPSELTENITIENNLFEDIDADRYGGFGVFLLAGGAKNVRVAHNTSLNTLRGFEVTGRGADWTIVNNIINGPFNAAGGVGAAGLSAAFEGWVYAGNVHRFEHLFYAEWHPPGNRFVATWEEVGFADKAKGNYRLSAASKLKKKGAGGKDPGCDLEELEKATQGALSGVSARS